MNQRANVTADATAPIAPAERCRHGLRRPISHGSASGSSGRWSNSKRLHTICEGALPNLGRVLRSRHATFLLAVRLHPQLRLLQGGEGPGSTVPFDADEARTGGRSR